MDTERLQILIPYGKIDWGDVLSTDINSLRESYDIEQEIFSGRKIEKRFLPQRRAGTQRGFGQKKKNRDPLWVSILPSAAASLSCAFGFSVPDDILMIDSNRITDNVTFLNGCFILILCCFIL